MTTYLINEEHNGIEIYFDNKPAAQTRDTLKSDGFRWHNAKKCWYAKNTPARLSLAESLAEGTATETPKKEDAPANKYGVKVGDIFTASWGYDQTNVDFFQVIALCGKQSVRVREVRPEVLDINYQSSMSEDVTYRLTGEILPPAPFSVFIKNQEKGDLKRLDKWGDRIVFKLSSFAHAWKEDSETVTHYESHYA